MTEVYIALGSNVGDSRAHIKNAIKLLNLNLHKIRTAPLYTSKAVGYTKQPNFLNTVLQADTNLDPLELLKFIKEVEAKIGRSKTFRWGPREIDIDIVFYGLLTVNKPQLLIPHPRFHERDFVLLPLLHLNPGFIDPKTGKSLQQLYNQLPLSKRSILS